MTPEETKKAFQSLHDLVFTKFDREEGLILQARRDAEASGPEDRASHLLFMCEEGQRLVDAGKIEKAMRWLGFVQGSLCAMGWTTISAMKDMNRGTVLRLLPGELRLHYVSMRLSQYI